MTGHEVKAIQAANAAARKLAAATKKRAPTMADVLHGGLLTETHSIRLAQLQALTGTALPAGVGE
jgi:hypothetical protein